MLLLHYPQLSNQFPATYSPKTGAVCGDRCARQPPKPFSASNDFKWLQTLFIYSIVIIHFPFAVMRLHQSLMPPGRPDVSPAIWRPNISLSLSRTLFVCFSVSFCLQLLLYSVSMFCIWTPLSGIWHDCKLLAFTWLIWLQKFTSTHNLGDPISICSSAFGHVGWATEFNMRRSEIQINNFAIWNVQKKYCCNAKLLTQILLAKQ